MWWETRDQCKILFCFVVVGFCFVVRIFLLHLYTCVVSYLLVLANELYAFIPTYEQPMPNGLAIYYKVNEFDLLSVSPDAVS